MKNEMAIKIIDRLGGTTCVATIFDITKASVSNWRKKGIPPARLMYLEVARPDVLIGIVKGVAVRKRNQQSAARHAVGQGA